MLGFLHRPPPAVPKDFPSRQRWLGEEPRFGRVRHAVSLTTRYFLSRVSLSGWCWLLAAIMISFGSVYVAVKSNAFDKTLYDAIGAREAGKLPHLIFMFVLLGALTALTASLNSYFRDGLIIRWRRWLANDLTGRWLARDRFYAIERGTLVENPDQRMSQDVKDFVEGTTLLVLGFIQVTTSVISFTVILWGLSAPFSLGFIGIPVTIPGDMVWAAFIYAAISTWAVYKFGQPLVRRTMEQQHYEADFRYRLVALRRNAEQVALSRIQKAEWGRLIALYERVKRNFMALILVRLFIQSSTQMLSFFRSVLPIILTLPRYFARQMTMGDIMQTSSAFTQMTSALSWFIQVYDPTVANTLSAANRLYLLDRMIERAEPPGIELIEDERETIEAKALALRLPTGELLTRIGDWTIRSGERWIIRGRSGAGKSTLLRAIAGIWPEGDGSIALPADARIMFVPQKTYMATGTLRSIISFPDPETRFTVEQCEAAMRQAKLGDFVDRLEEGESWSQTMSPGEQQRVAFARILLHRPTHLFLDESTSALDPETARAMYRQLDDLQGLTLVSVVHTRALNRFHDHLLDIGGDGVTSQPLPPEQKAFEE